MKMTIGMFFATVAMVTYSQNVEPSDTLYIPLIPIAYQVDNPPAFDKLRNGQFYWGEPSSVEIYTFVADSLVGFDTLYDESYKNPTEGFSEVARETYILGDGLYRCLRWDRNGILRILLTDIEKNTEYMDSVYNCVYDEGPAEHIGRAYIYDAKGLLQGTGPMITGASYFGRFFWQVGTWSYFFDDEVIEIRKNYVEF